MFKPSNIIKNLAFVSGVIALSLGFSYAVFAVWQEPTLNPPDGNAAPPLNTGTIGQSKTGWLNSTKFFVGDAPTAGEQAAVNGYFRTSAGAYITGSGTTGLIVANGNVGIGTTAPTSPLHVVPGEIKLESTTALEYTDIHFSNNRSAAPFGKEYVVGNYAPDMADVDLRNKFFIRDNTGGGDMLIIDENGNVGIGTTTPGAKLHLAKASGAADLELQSLPGNTGSADIHLKNPVQEFSMGTQGTGDPNVPNSFFIHDAIAGGVSGYRFVIKPTTGNIGIGTITPGQKLEINGGVRLNTVDAMPACSVATRGTFWFVQSAAGVKDSVVVCAKDAAGFYLWRTLY